jgi:type II secretory pathway pseudopilin PulG
MIRRADRPPRQRGAALLLALTAAISAAAAVLVGGLPDRRAEKERHNAMVLAAAKEALIGYAVAKGNPPGSFPCPDLANNNGTAASSCSGGNMIGRLPWKTIGLADLRDADGECLWYALSPAFKNGATNLNLNTAGTLTVKDERGATVASQALAVVFAPGGAVPGNDRMPTGKSLCGGNTNAANYLDTSANGISNASGNRTGNAFTFVFGDRGERFNDRLSYVVAADLFSVLKARVAAEIRGDDANGLRRYFALADSLPWAASVAGGAQQTLRTAGYVPFGDADMFYPGSPWLNANGWFKLAAYEVVQPNQARITIGGTSYAYTLP